MHYDYLVVGAGLFGCVFAHEMKEKGFECLVIDKRNHLGGNVYTKDEHGYTVHEYGAHIFHTSNEEIWEYINRFAKFNNYINSPLASYGDELYNLPINMNTFAKMWNIKTPQEAKEIIDAQVLEAKRSTDETNREDNLENHVLSMVGKDIYEKLIQGYTQKQWGRECRDLPSSIIKRLPIRFTYDNNYFNDRFQGIPIGGYTPIIEKLLEDITVITGIEYKSFSKNPNQYGIDDVTWDKVIYTGMIDEFFDYSLGHLDYRSLRFEKEYLDNTDNYQGNAVVNYTDNNVPYTRIIEHKHFEKVSGQNLGQGTVITREYPKKWEEGDEPYYPINDAKNTKLYEQYKELASTRQDVIFAGRLGEYKYYDMDKVIEAALKLSKEILCDE